LDRFHIFTLPNQRLRYIAQSPIKLYKGRLKLAGLFFSKPKCFTPAKPKPQGRLYSRFFGLPVAINMIRQTRLRLESTKSRRWLRVLGAQSQHLRKLLAGVGSEDHPRRLAVQGKAMVKQFRALLTPVAAPSRQCGTQHSRFLHHTWAALSCPCLGFPLNASGW